MGMPRPIPAHAGVLGALPGEHQCGLMRHVAPLNHEPPVVGKEFYAPISTPNCPARADLQKVVRAWPELSEPLRRAILAIANSGTEKEGR